MKTWGEIYNKHLSLGADGGYAAFAADEYSRRQEIMAATMERHFQKKISFSFFPKGAGNENAATCTAAANEPPPLTIDALRQTMAMMTPAAPTVRFMESEHITVDRVRWEGGGHHRCETLMTPHRAFALLTLVMLAAALQAPLLALAVAFALRERGHWEPVARQRIVEQVPNPDLFQVQVPSFTPSRAQRTNEIVFVGHPATVALLRVEAERRGLGA